MAIGIPVFEAVEWREPAPNGGSNAQVFRLLDGRFVLVKFPENPQGELVLANEFLSCQLAEMLVLPVNRAVLVSIDERLLRSPRQDNRIPAAFSAGIRCGMIRFEHAEAVAPNDIPALCDNAAEMHGLAVFEQLVCRQDGRQLLMHPSNGAKGKLFGAYDYGYSFGGQPNWSEASLGSLPPATLPGNDPCSGKPYEDDGEALGPIVERLRQLTVEPIQDMLMRLHTPRWGATAEAVAALAPVLLARGQTMVREFDRRYRPLLEGK